MNNREVKIVTIAACRIEVEKNTTHRTSLSSVIAFNAYKSNNRCQTRRVTKITVVIEGENVILEDPTDSIKINAGSDLNPDQWKKLEECVFVPGVELTVECFKGKWRFTLDSLQKALAAVGCKGGKMSQFIFPTVGTGMNPRKGARTLRPPAWPGSV